MHSPWGLRESSRLLQSLGHANVRLALEGDEGNGAGGEEAQASMNDVVVERAGEAVEDDEITVAFGARNEVGVVLPVAGKLKVTDFERVVCGSCLAVHHHMALAALRRACLDVVTAGGEPEADVSGVVAEHNSAGKFSTQLLGNGAAWPLV